MLWNGKWIAERLCGTSAVKASSGHPKPPAKVGKKPKQNPKPSTTSKKPRKGADGTNQVKGR
jgi:hypothetical protein